ncbi:SMP-30/gluconolactonase/LRE family protein [Hyphococcus sp.]|uniref:SMP-30/gluconolactonase/LRE family protein n=1 Tax=Hyphococcus sp. TaxID=2038636 RepID=UPI003CCBEEA6
MKRFLPSIFGALALAGAAAAQAPQTYQDHMARAGEAFQSEDWAALNEHLDAAQEIRTYSLYVWRNRILARMLAERPDEALALAEKAAGRGLVLNLSGHPAFEALTALPQYAPIAAQMEANAAPAGEADIVFNHEQADLLPEALAYGKRKIFYLGSVANGSILKAGRKGDVETLATAPGGVFDIEARGKTVWAVVNNQLAYKDADPEAPFAAVMAFRAKDGALQRDIRAAEDEALFGDLEIAKDGTVYASDSLTPRLFRMAPDGETLDVFAEDPRFANLQGIALDEKNNRIFVADYLTGLFVIDTQTGAATALENTADAHLGGIDGLYLYDGDLIGIQNGATPQRIVRIEIDDEVSEITGFTVMQQALEEWNEPTHGAVVDGAFHYIATSNWPSYDQEWNVREDAALKPLKIMSVPLE